MQFEATTIADVILVLPRVFVGLAPVHWRRRLAHVLSEVTNV